MAKSLALARHLEAPTKRTYVGERLRRNVALSARAAQTWPTQANRQRSDGQEVSAAHSMSVAAQPQL